MRRALLALLAVAACKPAAKPAPGDTTTVTVDTTAPVNEAVVAAPGTTVDTVRRDSAWVVALADSTRYGHTTLLTITTVQHVATASVDSTKPKPVPPPSPTIGLSAGLWNWPADSFCSHRVSATAVSVGTADIIGALRRAKACNVRLVLVPTRMYLTTTGTNHSPFSATQAQAYADRMAKVLVPDTLRKYDAWLIGFNLADDYACAACWGGVPVTPAQIETWARYLRVRIPGLRLGVRAAPTAFPAKSATLQAALDYAWAQYSTDRGDAKTYFDKQVATAKAQGLGIALGLNLKYCNGITGGPACTPSEVRTYLGLAAQYPENCVLLGWTYDAAIYPRAGQSAAIDSIVRLAARKPGHPCQRITP